MKFHLARWRSLCCLVLGVFALGMASAAKAAPEIDVILWFDTEDYLLPASDDSAKRLAEMLTSRGIRATFKVVGEKARVLEKRGRQDVIDALRHHAIGYHANFHSVHPTPAEYLANCDLLDGVQEFIRREGGGAADVRWVFGQPSLACYGQPGSSWAPETIAGLKAIGVAPHGVPCYVDEGTHVGLDHQPFWYAGGLIVYHMGPNYTRMDLHDPDAVEPACKKVSEIADRLRARGGGLISIFYHPCEWVHQKFWDGVNFARGANPPRSEWKAPPQRPAEETEAAFQRFGQYIDHIRSIPGVRFVTAADLPLLYPDAVRQDGATSDELHQLAGRILKSDGTGLDFVRLEAKAFSLADQFEAFTRAIHRGLEDKPLSGTVPVKGLLGPDQPPPTDSSLKHLSAAQFQQAARDVFGFIEAEQRVPARVFIGPDAVSPSNFLVAMAAAYQRQKSDASTPDLNGGVDLGHDNEILPARHIAADTPGLFGGWIIHKEGFRAPHLLEVARLQAWTLKPALRANP